MKNYIFCMLLMVCLSSIAQVPMLNSRPSATGVLYLDFDGQLVQASLWNNGNQFTCDNPNLSATQITDVHSRVAEDYKLFNLNVTTSAVVYNQAPLSQRSRIIITPTNFFAPGNAGIAYMGTFTWGDDTPAFAFASNTTSTKQISETISHELGHTMGLCHQSTYDMYCNKIAEYNNGQGTGEIGWAPIMGNPLEKNFTTWHNGKRNISCDQQNDIEVIASKIQGTSLLTDDVVNTITNAPSVTVQGVNISASGIVNSATDVDVFKLAVNAESLLQLKILPFTNNTQASGNIDILIRLLNSTGTIIKSYNYSEYLMAEIDTTLTAGTYYLSVDGTSNANVLTDYGSTGSYSITGTLRTLASLPLYKVDITGAINNNQHSISWLILADEPITQSVLEYSTNGVNFVALTTVDYRTNAYSYKPFTSNNIYYRLKCSLRNGSFKYSNIVALQGIKLTNKLTLLNNVANDKLLVTVKERMQYQIIDANGKVITTGTLQPNSLNQINITQVTTGLYFIKAYTGSDVVTQRLIKN